VVTSDEMLPIYRTGETVYANPDAEVKQGDFVLVSYSKLVEVEREYAVEIEICGVPERIVGVERYYEIKTGSYPRRFIAYDGSDVILDQFNPPMRIRMTRPDRGTTPAGSLRKIVTRQEIEDARPAKKDKASAYRQLSNTLHTSPSRQIEFLFSDKCGDDAVHAD